MHAITSGELVYPDPIMQPSIGMHEMHLNPSEYLSQPSQQNFGSSDSQRPAQNEQDMERFIDIFLQVETLLSAPFCHYLFVLGLQELCSHFERKTGLSLTPLCRTSFHAARKKWACNPILPLHW